MKDSNSVILPLKVVLMLAEFFLVVLIGYSRVSDLIKKLMVSYRKSSSTLASTSDRKVTSEIAPTTLWQTCTC